MDEVKKEAIENRVKEIDVAEHVEALVNGEGDLSEEFKRKAATVFEAAVKSKIRTEIGRLEDEYEEKLKGNVQTATDEMTNKVDTYLNYVTEEWMKENELAVERGLKGEIAEDFISGLKQLFEDHYIDIPDEKYDVLEAQSEKISELLTPKGTNSEVEIIYQSIFDLHTSCPNHQGDWYFTGNYPTPGGVKVVNKAFMNYMEGNNSRAYS